MNRRIIAIGVVILVISLGAGVLLHLRADSMTVSERLASDRPYDASAACFVLAGIGAYIALYGFVVRPESSVSSLASIFGSVGRRGMVAMGLGLFPLSVFLLFLGWAFTDAVGIGYPPGWIALLAGFVLGVAGVTVTIMGIASPAEKR